MEAKSILLVDDESAIRDIVRSYLELNYGDKINVLEAKNGIEATQKVTFQQFHCIITDLKMPKREGYAFVQSCKESYYNQHTPIVILTGFPDHQKESAIKVNHLLQKPLKPDDLVKVIDTQMKLGSVENRVAADLFNTKINAASKFIAEAFNETPEYLEPQIKRSGAPLPGDIQQIISMKVGKVTNHYAMAFEWDFLNELSTKVENVNSSDYKLLSQIASTIIIKHAVNYLSSQNDIVIKENKSFDELANPAEVIALNGISLPIKISFGTLSCLALWKRK